LLNGNSLQTYFLLGTYIRVDEERCDGEWIGWMEFLGGLLGAMFRAGSRQAPQLGRMVPWRSDSSNLRGAIRSYRTQPWFVPVKTSVDCVVRGVIYVIARCRRSKRPIFAIERECHHTRCYQLIID
jgi:hypothetical protein